MKPVTEPLSDQETDELAEFLVSEAAPEGTMDISTLDGFLTAIVIGPEVVLPSRWIPLVWGDAEGPEFETLQQAERLFSLLMRHMNSIAADFQVMPELFEPLFYEEKKDGKSRWIVDEWCSGFMIAVGEFWSEEARARMVLEGAEWIKPIYLFGTEQGQEVVEDLIDDEKHYDEWVGQIVPALAQIHAFWRERRTDLGPGLHYEEFDGPTISNAPKVGRNDPCPCGSGKKFKKCCGAPS